MSNETEDNPRCTRYVIWAISVEELVTLINKAFPDKPIPYDVGELKMGVSRGKGVNNQRLKFSWYEYE